MHSLVVFFPWFIWVVSVGVLLVLLFSLLFVCSAHWFCMPLLLFSSLRVVQRPSPLGAEPVIPARVIREVVAYAPDEVAMARVPEVS